jgi:uroporphyrinogen-III decarboxylase
MLAAIHQEPVDRVPHATYNIHPFAGSLHADDPSYRPLLEQIAATAGVAIKVGDQGNGWGPSPEFFERRVEGRGDARTEYLILHTPKGDLSMVSRIPENKPGMAIRHFLVTDDDLEKYLSLPYPRPTVDLTQVRAVHASAGERALILVGYSEPMYATASLFSFEDFALRCATDRSSIRRMIDRAFEPCLEYVGLLARACRGLEVVLHTVGPEICTPPMLAPALFAELVTPYMTRLIEVIHEAGLRAAIHCHGHVREVLPQILATGCDLLEPIEPPPQGNIGLQELLEQTRGRLTLMGHIQDQDFYTAQPGEMTRRVEEIARAVDGGTGYIMSPTCTPFQRPCSEVYRANYLEWLQAAARVLGE